MAIKANSLFYNGRNDIINNRLYFSFKVRTNRIKEDISHSFS